MRDPGSGRSGSPHLAQKFLAADGDSGHNNLMRFGCVHTVPVQKSNGSLVTNRHNRLRSVVLRRDGAAGTG